MAPRGDAFPQVSYRHADFRSDFISKHDILLWDILHISLLLTSSRRNVLPSLSKPHRSATHAHAARAGPLQEKAAGRLRDSACRHDVPPSHRRPPRSRPPASGRNRRIAVSTDRRRHDHAAEHAHQEPPRAHLPDWPGGKACNRGRPTVQGPPVRLLRRSGQSEG